MSKCGQRVGVSGLFGWSLAPAVALLLYSLVLRAPVAAVPPLLSRVASGLDVSVAWASLLTSIPVLCFGLLTPVASRLIGWLEVNHAGLYCLAGVILGSVVRSYCGLVGAVVGTVLIGAGITIGNIVVPLVIGRHFQHRIALMTGAYSSTVNITVALTTALSVPLADRSGWRLSIAFSGVVLGVIALVAWLAVYPPNARGMRKSSSSSSSSPLSSSPTMLARRVWRWRVGWLLAVAFAGHVLAFQSITTWLPSALAEELHLSATGAGMASSLFQAAGVVGPFTVDCLTRLARWPLERVVWVICVCWIVMPVGMAIIPAGWATWSVIGGTAQGAFFTALFLIVIQRSRNLDENRQLTAMVQGFGYVCAALGPVLLGWARQQQVPWSALFAGVAGVLVVGTVCIVAAIRQFPMPDSELRPDTIVEAAMG